MNSKNIKKVLKKKVDNWLSNIKDDEIKQMARDNVLITGGSIVSLLSNEKPNDYDVYFRTREAVLKIAKYYTKVFNSTHDTDIYVEEEKDSTGNIAKNGKISVFIRSSGVASDNSNGNEISHDFDKDIDEKETDESDKYRPVYLTSNAITLSDKIQIVIRFWGEIEEIHKNYDFVHCTCSFDYRDNKLILPAKALECIINKELYYVGSKYPLCSIIRARKFVNRGWAINAGQYLKMCLQLNELNLHNIETLRDQLTGVDSAYFDMAIRAIEQKKEKDKEWTVDNSYLFEVINRIF